MNPNDWLEKHKFRNKLFVFVFNIIFFIYIYFSVPYHRPKQRTLHEFLNRKSINKPIPFQNQKKAAAAIKMSKNELETYA